MPRAAELGTWLPYLGGVAALIAAFVHVSNARKAGLWKRTELGSNFLKELATNQELVFATRALDWYAGRLPVPENLLPLMPHGEKAIDHDRRVLRRAMRMQLGGKEMAADARLQIYRTAMDSLLSWMSVLANALDRKLFTVEDVADARHWVRKVAMSRFLHSFMRAYGYDRPMKVLVRHFFKREMDFSKKAVPGPPAGSSGDSAAPEAAASPPSEGMGS